VSAGETQGRARRRTTAIAALLAAVLAVAGVAVVVLRHHGDSGTATLRVADDGSAPTPSEEPTATVSETPSETPSAEPSASASEVSATPTGSDAGSSGGDSGSGGGGNGGGSGTPSYSDLGPMPPSSVYFPYSAGRQSWSGTSHGITMSVHMSPAEPKAGQTVTFDVQTSAAARCCYAYMVFGNGRGTPDVHCMQGPTGTSYDVRYTTIYNKPGRYEFLAGAMRGPSCDEQGDIYGYLEVAPGTSSGQGPSLPVVQVDNSTPPPKHQNDPAWMTLWGHARDEDGFIKKFIVDWGDGQTETFPGDVDCQRGSDGWPAPSEADVPYDPPPPHHYTSYGNFRIRLIAVSTACDGSDVQRGVATMTWSNPAPLSPEPSPTGTASP